MSRFDYEASLNEEMVGLIRTITDSPEAGAAAVPFLDDAVRYVVQQKVAAETERDSLRALAHLARAVLDDPYVGGVDALPDNRLTANERKLRDALREWDKATRLRQAGQLALPTGSQL